MAGPSEGRLDRAAEAVRAAAPGARTDTLVLDLADLSPVRGAATRIADTETVDLLVNNAGVMNLPERRTTRDGLEVTVGTNHLGHFAFKAQVWPAVRRSAAPRVVTVSAVAARWPTGRPDDLMSEKSYRSMDAHAKSKRADIVYTLELARRTGSSPVKAHVVHPGAAMTGLQQHGNGGLSRVITSIAARMLMGSAEGAAWPSFYTATSTHARSGDFIGPAGRDQTSGAPRPARLPTGSDDPAEGRRLWAVSERLTGVPFGLDAGAASAMRPEAEPPFCGMAPLAPRQPEEHAGGVTNAPIVVHRPSLTGGRRVSVHRRGRDEILGMAYSDHDLVVFLEGAGIADPEALLDDPRWVEWRDGPAHDFSAA
ncbi:SDR family NAD(P)-dependent oxidoreductase [Streptomyces parvulus]|uniref:SDR family NAD(P)-dependent oxidoreductase n=1 Tax=Streptomyces parvulus TaxID=146923 RepID=UPI00369A2C8D